MAFDRTKLVQIGTGDGKTVYMYDCPDTAASIVADNTYFGATLDGTDGLLRAGDIILAVCETGGTYDPVMLCVEAVGTGEVTTRA